MTDHKRNHSRGRLSRRQLLRIAGVGVAGTVAGCGSNEETTGLLPGNESESGQQPDDGASDSTSSFQREPGIPSGRVVDVHGDPVSGTTVKLLQSGPDDFLASTTTDDLGQFQFEQLEIDADYSDILLVARKRTPTDGGESGTYGSWFHTRLYRNGQIPQFDLTDGDLRTIPLDHELLVPPTTVADSTGGALGMVTFWRFVGNEFQQQSTGMESPNKQTFNIEVANTKRSDRPGSTAEAETLTQITGDTYDLASGLFLLSFPEENIWVDYGIDDGFSMGPSLEVAGLRTARHSQSSPQFAERWHPQKTTLPVSELIDTIDPETGLTQFSKADAEAIKRIEEGRDRLFSAIPVAGRFYELIEMIDWAIGDAFGYSGEFVGSPGTIDPNEEDTTKLAWQSDTLSTGRDEAAVRFTVPVQFQYGGDDTSTLGAQSEWAYDANGNHPDGDGLFRWTVSRGPHGHIGTRTKSDSRSEHDPVAGEVVLNVDTEGEVLSSPTVYENTVFVGSNDNHLYAIDTEDQTVRWRFETDGAVYSSPCVHDGTVYVGSGLGRNPEDTSLYAIDVDSGNKQWRFETNDKVKASPAVHNGTVYVPSRDGFLYEVNAMSGEKQWQRPVGTTAESSPTIRDGQIYVGSFDNYMYAFDTATGEKLWEVQTGDIVRPSPTCADQTVFVGSSDSTLYAVDSTTGEIEWEFDTRESEFGIQSSPTVFDGTVYVGAYDSKVYAVGAVTGEKEWEFTTGDSVLSSPTVFSGSVYVGSQDGSLYAIDRKAGTKTWEVSADGTVFSSPTAVNGRVYVGSGDGSLYVVSIVGNGASEGTRTQLRTLGHHGQFKNDAVM